MASVRVDVDVDMDEFDTQEICEELCSRLRSSGLKKLTNKQRQELKEELEEINMKIGNVSIPYKSVEDKMKIELLNSVWNNYTYWEFEKLFK